MLNALSLRIKHSLVASFSRPIDSVAQERLRLRFLGTVAVLKLFNFIGGAWDIQWHVEIGRDSLWIPPHLLVVFAFTTGILLVAALILYETGLNVAGHDLPHTTHLGPFSAPAAAFAIFFGYLAALLSGAFDELWHRIFGIDATLWSPPHLLIMAAIMVVDFSLILGLVATSRRLGYDFSWKSPLTWGLVLTGAYAFEAVNFQMGEAFIVGYRNGGAGLYGLLFPLLVGIFMPFSMLVLIRLARRFWVVLLAFGLTLLLQYMATGISAAGFAILKPVSVIDEYVRQNPQSTAAMARAFAQLLGNDGLIGFHQAWSMWLAGPSLLLVALVGLAPWAQRRPLLAAPVFAVSMVLFCYLWFQQIPALRSYPISGFHVLLATIIAGLGSLLTGGFGIRLANLVEQGAAPASNG